MADLTISQGDYGFELALTIQTATSGVFDLTGKTATLKVWRTGAPTSILSSGACTITGATTGECTYTAASTDVLVKGKYKVEVELTEAGKIDSTKAYDLEVTESA